MWWMGTQGHTIPQPLLPLALWLALGLALTTRLYLLMKGALSTCVTLSKTLAWPTPSHQQLGSSSLDCPSLSLGPKVPSSNNGRQFSRISLDQPSNRETGVKGRKETEQVLRVLSCLPPAQGRRGLRWGLAMGGRGSVALSAYF